MKVEPSARKKFIVPVALHQLGVATGTMNFFRALGSTFIVSAFGAIVLAGAPVTRGMSAGAVLAGTGAAPGLRGGFPPPPLLPTGPRPCHSPPHDAGAGRPSPPPPPRAKT